MKNKGGSPRLWRSLAEYDQDPEFQNYLENEFGTPLTDAPPNTKQRRRFMQLMSASFAMAGAAGCRWEQDKLLPMTRRPEGMIPGVPRYFHSAMELGGVGLPLKVKSYDGRPIKVDGNPEHLDTLGASRAYEQASVLGLYDPDRSRGPAKVAAGALTNVVQAEFEKFAFQHFNELRATGGQGLFVLSEASSSLAVAAAKESLAKAFPASKWFEYEAVNRDNSRQGARLAFGETLRPLVALDKADIIVCLDADPLASGAESLAQARGFAKNREPETGHLNRLYSVESSLSPTGSQADHRLAIRSAYVKSFAVALERAVSELLGQTSTQPEPAAKFLQEPRVAKFLSVVAKDLVAHKGKGVVLVGEPQPPEVHALAHRLNAILENAGAVVSYTKDEGDADLRNGLARLTSELAGAKTLLIVDGNPVYTASGDVPFEQALAKVPTAIHLGLYRDETARKCHWHAPLSHYLEAWGDCLSVSGTRLLAQPLIAPLYASKSLIEFVALVTRAPEQDGQSLVRKALGITDDRAWARAVHDGMLPGTKAPTVAPTLAPLAAITLQPSELGGLGDGTLELNFRTDPKIYDGRFANNGWLQELPEPVMKLTWDNAAYIHPETAKQLGVDDCHLVTLTVGSSSVVVPALMSPAQARGAISVALGYGRTDAGVVAGAKDPFDADPVPPVGTNVYPLRTAEAWDTNAALKVSPLGKKVRLATTQDKHPMDDLGREGTQERLPQIVRQDTFEGFKKDPKRVKSAVHHPPLLSLWHDAVSYDGYKWGMAIDLNKCTGCNNCVVACNSENNIAVVGKDQVLMGRELHWIRIDRYFQGENPDEPDQVHNQPVICQHCEHAPCEQVCPVEATSHSSEGLNDMTYNRCIGTRYCSNNCPYKVRRFNYFNFNLDLKEKRNEPKRMTHNPDVTLRFRGVMEKCSFCVQRIQSVKIQAKNARRKIEDQEVRSACQDACPTQAITFGDLNTKGSAVSEKARSPRGYALLEELNIRPRVTYLARITNPHPELAPAHPAEQQHGAEGNSESHG